MSSTQQSQHDQPDQLAHSAGPVARVRAPVARRTRAAFVALARWSVIPLVAGLLGSLTAIILMIALRLVWGTPTLPELVGERLLPLLTADQFVSLLLRFAPHSKTTPLFYALVGQFVLGVLISPVWALVARPPTPGIGRWPTLRAWRVAGAFALGMEALTLLLFWPVLFGNLVGYPFATALLLNCFATLIIFSGFMAVVALCDHWLRLVWGTAVAAHASPHVAAQEKEEKREDEAKAAPVEGLLTSALTRAVSRRSALGTAGLVVVGAGVGFLATRELLAAYLARSNLAYEGMETDYAISQATQLTPNQDFYVVSKNVLDPTVVLDHWRLEIVGMVRQPRTWTYAEALALPDETRAVTFECIANGVGGHLLSSAEWTGFTLAHVISEAGGADPHASHVIFSSVDGYNSSLPLADLLEARTLLAYKMNGATLPERHGYPLRAVVPGRYGEQSPKWLTRVELADQPHQGFYQSQGWYDGQVHTISRIERPAVRTTIPLAPITVGGLAFAGIRGIWRVEVSADGGATWTNATLVPPLSDQAWVYWTWRWTPTARGSWELVVRATDGMGAVQTATEQGTVPNGATGWHRVTVTVT